MQVSSLPLEGLRLIRPDVLADTRGFFLESYRRDKLLEAGVDVEFVQDNHSRSERNTIRGLHFQQASSKGPGQAKLIRVVRGEILDVAVDIRPGSPTFGGWWSELLNEQNQHQLFVPVGFAHGFCVLSEVADVLYKVSSTYDSQTEAGFAFDDPCVDVLWPITREQAILSERDLTAPVFSEVT